MGGFGGLWKGFEHILPLQREESVVRCCQQRRFLSRRGGVVRSPLFLSHQPIFILQNTSQHHITPRDLRHSNHCLEACHLSRLFSATHMTRCKPPFLDAWGDACKIKPLLTRIFEPVDPKPSPPYPHSLCPTENPSNPRCSHFHETPFFTLTPATALAALPSQSLGRLRRRFGLARTENQFFSRRTAPVCAGAGGRRKG